MTRPRWRTGHTWRKLSDQVRKEESNCWLCGVMIDMHAAPRTRWSFSVDHVVPASIDPSLALVRGNLRAAHYGCNARRRDGRRGTGKPKPPPPSSRAW